MAENLRGFGGAPTARPGSTTELRRPGLGGLGEDRGRLDGRQGLVGAAQAPLPLPHPPGQGAPPFPDLVKRDFSADAINEKWCGDLTEIPTEEGKLYLASVLDLASRRLPGFAIGEHHDAELAAGALKMAAAVRGGDVRGVIFHSDKGSEFTASAFEAGLRSASGWPSRPGASGPAYLPANTYPVVVAGRWPVDMWTS